MRGCAADPVGARPPEGAWRGGSVAVALALLLPALLLPAAARGHGRSPAMVSVAFNPSAPDTIAAATTFGALVSKDGGASWRWICDEVIGVRGLTDPVLAYTSMGSLFATTGETLRVSRDGGCSWDDVPPFEALAPSDVLVTQTKDGEAIFVTTSRSDRRNGLFRSRDDGVTFEEVGVAREQALWSAVRGGGGALYASAWWYDPAAAWLARSDDGGARWTVIEEPRHAGPFYVLAVSPASPDVMFAWTSPPDRKPEVHEVLRSEDGGRSFAVVATLPLPPRSLVISRDGAKAWLAVADGVSRSEDGGRTFAPLARPQNHACVAARGQELLACGSTFDEGWALARSHDGGDHWSPLLRFDEVAGVLRCSDRSPTTKCAAFWPALAIDLGIDVPSGALPGGQAGGDASAPPDGGAPAPGDGGVRIDAARPPPTDEGGCGHAGGRPTSGALPAVALGLLGAAWGRRTRRRA